MSDNFWNYTFLMNIGAIRHLKKRLHELEKQKNYLKREFTYEAEKNFRCMFN